MLRCFRLLLVSTYAVTCGLIIGCLVSGLALGVFAYFGWQANDVDAGLSLSLGIGMLATVFAIIGGAPFAFGLGVPIYMLALVTRRASYLAAIIAALVLGGVAYAFGINDSIALPFLIIVAVTTHYFGSKSPWYRGLIANNSSKPKPLRGSA